MPDSCYCGKRRCKNPHGYEKVIAKLMALTPEDMGIIEHRLKAHFRQLRKKMSWVKAWEAAKEETKKDGKRTAVYFPSFTPKERVNIKRYKPKNPIQHHTPY